MHQRLGSVLLVAALAASGCAGPGARPGPAGHPPSNRPTYTIGYDGPLSGPNAPLGRALAFAVQLAVQQAAASHQFGRLPFRLLFRPVDDAGPAAASSAAARRLIADPTVLGVVGPTLSEAVAAAGPLYAQAGLATVSPAATAPQLAGHGWKTFFRVVVDDNAQGAADAAYATGVLRVHSVLVVDDGGVYGRSLADSFARTAGSLGLVVVRASAPGTFACQAGGGSVGQYPRLARQAEGNGLVFYAGYSCDLARLARALHAVSFAGRLMSGGVALGEQFVAQAGVRAADGTLISCPCDLSSTSPSARVFAADFRRLTGLVAGAFAAQAYDAADTIISVLARLGTQATRSSVLAGLSSVQFPGVTGSVHFLPNGNIARTSIYMYVVSDGRLRELGPVSWVSAGT